MKWLISAFSTKQETWEETTQHHHLANHNLFDLLCIGVGATVGSGVFVLTGLVARVYSGPGVIFSWVIAGIACCFSAMSYAELSGRMPSPGSAYTFVYSTLGELPAYITGWCLTLECGMSASAVARNWGIKFLNFAEPNLIHLDQGFNLYSTILLAATVFLFLCGREVSKQTVNIFTLLKVLLIFFMISMGLYYFKFENISNFTPMGVSGILKGATNCFFGFVGYDEVCCMALETNNVQKTLPLAVFGTIAIVSTLYVLSSLSLVGMVNYELIDKESGFSDAFNLMGNKPASIITALGELITLPLVVIVSFLPQPRVFYAMAKDGLFPSIFAVKDQTGNLFYGIMISGIFFILIGAFIPFSALDELISAGVLFCFNLTNISLILARLDDPNDIPFSNITLSRCKLILFVFTFQCTLVTILLTHMTVNDYDSIVSLLVVFGLILLVFSSVFLFLQCPERSTSESYQVPFVPFTPMIGIFINFFLICQLSWYSLQMLFSYFLLSVISYFIYRNYFSELLDPNFCRSSQKDLNLEFISKHRKDNGVLSKIDIIVYNQIHQFDE